MAGWVSLSLEAEPDASLALEIEGERHTTVLVRERAGGALLGMGSRSVRRVYYDGQIARLGYLGRLRAAGGRRGLARLAAGFAAIEASRRSDELDFDLTSVVADNSAARRLLERGVRGLPSYRELCSLSTFLVPTGGRFQRTARVRAAADPELGEIAAHLDACQRELQFAPVWTEADLRSGARCRGLAPGDFLVLRQAGELVGCAAIWDQRAFKQVVVRGYAPLLARTRPVVNLALRGLGQPRLPRAGETLAIAHLSHLAVRDWDPEIAAELIAAARARAAERGLNLLALGATESHPLRPLFARLPAREYRSTLYCVQAPHKPVRGDALGGRIPHVEVATL